jgi:transcriptional regulator with XRE-family HTH domain
METNLGELTARIRQELNEYQDQLGQRLNQLLAQGLISRRQIEEIIREAKVTGEEVVNALKSPASQVEEVTEIYVYTLFENYQESVEERIAEIKKESEKRNSWFIIPDFWGWLRSPKNSQKTHSDRTP